jgi:hypothetical protein
VVDRVQSIKQRQYDKLFMEYIECGNGC